MSAPEATPAVTVLMPVRDGARHVAQAIDSVLAQTFRSFEFLVIDDGSTDETPKILAEYARRDPRVRVLTQTNTGLTRALNRGIREARAPLIARQDADDVSLPTRLERMLAVFQGPMEGKDAPALAGSLWTDLRESADGAVREVKPAPFYLLQWLPEPAWRPALQLGNLFTHGTFVFRRDAVLALGGYREKFRYSQDYDLLLRMEEKHRIHLVREPLYQRRFHAGSIGLQNRRRQFLFAALAALFALERREEAKKGTDSYIHLDEHSLEALTHELARRHPARARLMTGFAFLRNRDRAALRYLG